MGSRDLELVIQSAQGLRNVHNLQRARTLKPLAIVSIRDNNNNLCSSKEETPVDNEGETNPQWNHRVTFNIDITRVTDNQLALVFKLKSRRKIRAKYVGEVRVPITGLEGFGDANAGAEIQMIEDVVNVGGTSQQGGKLYFSYKFGDSVQHPPASTANMRNSATSNGQRRHGTVKRLMGKVADEVATTVAGLAAAAGITAVFNGISGDDDDRANDEEPDRRVD